MAPAPLADTHQSLLVLHLLEHFLAMHRDFSRGVDADSYPAPLTPSTVTTILSLITMLSFSFLLKTNMGRSFSSLISKGFVPQKTKKADMVGHPKVSGHVGLLVNEPPGGTGLLFI